MKTYNAIKIRMRSRFTKNGVLASKLFIVSSKKSEMDFIESYVQTIKDSPNVIISDEPQWNVKPPGTFSNKRFKVAVGNKKVKSKIVSKDDSIEALIKQGYEIMDVPLELYADFNRDIDRALMDLAGVSCNIVSKFITYENLHRAHCHRRNPFSNTIISLGTMDSLEIMEFFDPSVVPEEIYTKPMYIHLDCSLTGDRTGISGVGVMGLREDMCYVDGEVIPVQEMVYAHVFSIGIQCPAGAEISFEKSRRFIYYLKYNLGWNIKGISLDGYQSADSKQQFIQAGFDARIVSLDRTPDGYMYLKASINERRISMLELEELDNEIINLEQNNQTGKVDHPLNGCFTADTKIKLVDGRDLSISELLLEQEYKDNYVYTFNEDKHVIEPKRIKKVFQTKLITDLIKVTLDNDEVIFCTPEHLFMLRDGTYEEIQNLKLGDSLMPLYTKYPEGRFSQYRMYYEPFEETWHFEHRQFCNDLIHKRGYVVHHCNYKKYDNTPNNLKCVSKDEHMRIHNNQTLNYNKISESVKRWHADNKNEEWYHEMHRECRNKQYQNYLENHPEEIAVKQLKQDERMKHISEIESTFNVKYDELSNAEKAAYGKKLWYKNNPGCHSYKPETHKNLHEIHRTKCWITNGSENRYINKTDEVPDGWRRGRTINYEMHKKKEYKNHKIKLIEKVHKVCRVYDLEIEDNHNFALSAGVIVHNSKDIADSVTGALYNASQMVDRSSLYVLDDYKSISDANDYVASTSLRDEVVSSLDSGFKNEIKHNEDNKKFISAVKNKDFEEALNVITKESDKAIIDADKKRLEKIKSQISQADKSIINDNEIEDSYFNGGNSDMLIW